MKLDIGCGAFPKGDVNIDLYVGVSPHFHNKSFKIDPKKIPNFVQCDANSLPFKNHAFNQCSCSHVLEHSGIKPIQCIKEMVRVTNGQIKIVVPHRVWDAKIKHFDHKRNFNVTTMQQLLKKLELPHEIEVKYVCFPHRYICLIRLPKEITIRIPTDYMTKL